MTHSIVARDRDTGEFGVAVQSHYFYVGPTVPWAIAGVGTVAMQSHVNVSFGPPGIDYLRAGHSAEQAHKEGTRECTSRVEKAVRMLASEEMHPDIQGTWIKRSRRSKRRDLRYGDAG
jgi:uncharacterized Ntn-hydrolase superfamily protein